MSVVSSPIGLALSDACSYCYFFAAPARMAVGWRLKPRLRVAHAQPQSLAAQARDTFLANRSLEAAKAAFAAFARMPLAAASAARLARRLEANRRYAKGTHPAVDTSPRLPRDRRDYRFGSALPGSLPPVEPPAESAASGGGGNFRPSGCSPCSRTMVPSFAIA